MHGYFVDSTSNHSRTNNYKDVFPRADDKEFRERTKRSLSQFPRLSGTRRVTLCRMEDPLFLLGHPNRPIIPPAQSPLFPIPSARCHCLCVQCGLPDSMQTISESVVCLRLGQQNAQPSTPAMWQWASSGGIANVAL